MFWEGSLSVLIRIFSLVAVFLLLTVQGASAASSVPFTVEDDLGVLSWDERETCDPEIWDVMKDRAWMEGQREITQNKNLIPRPDSVLSMTCFDSFLNHLATHGENNFPSEPRYSDGMLSGFITELMVDGDKFGIDADPMIIINVSTILRGGSGPGGLITSGVLELLVLDQLVDVDTVIGDALDLLSPLGVCNLLTGEDKNYYIDENFPTNMLGDRAVAFTPPPPGPGPTWTNINSSFGISHLYRNRPYTSAANTGGPGCQRMNNVWNRSKCYDFATESTLKMAQIPGPPPPAPPGGDHDGFYTVEQYKDLSLAGTPPNDYRTRVTECPIPQTDGREGLPTSLTDPDVLCDLAVHGFPGGISIGQLIAIILALSNNNPIWDTAYTGAYPPPNNNPPVSNGALDEYLHYLGLRDSTTCNTLTPVKTGYIVKRPNGDTYMDAVCPAPGCWFDPPSNIAGTGSCN